MTNGYCPECDGDAGAFSRRQFVQAVGAGAAVISAASLPRVVTAGEVKKQPKSETLVKKLYDTLTPTQKKAVCFEWDHVAGNRGRLRTHVSNNWHITKQTVHGKFFTKDQQELIEAIFWGLYNPQWHDRVKQQLKDDAGGFGKTHNIAIFGTPGSGKFEFVMTGRHLTIRCDGDSTNHTAFGGPIFYGHDPNHVFNEEKNHPNNVYWHQALKANALFKMLDGKPRKQALVKTAPRESKVHFRGKKGGFDGVPIADLSKDQQAHVQEVLRLLLEPYRQSDRQEVAECLKSQGGLDKCHLAFYQSGDIGKDEVWDIWRLEGPSFVWHWRGSPHVHVWVNIADDPSVKITTRG